MANLFDYLDWRGDLSLEQASFNDIDSLILSRLSYLPFDQIVPSSLESKITIEQASNLFFNSERAQSNIIMRQDSALLSEVATNPRFANMNLFGYVNQIDSEVEKQFAAIIIELAPHLFYLSYRGTDFSIVGWKEDFNMSFTTPVPAQKEAVHYLNEAATNLVGDFYLGGHSKGGNLAVYAAAFCRPQVQKRILTVYNNEGPGFDSSVLESSGYQNIAPKIKTFIPQSSVVGMLLQHEEEYFVIYSTQIGLMQHDLYSWEVNRDQLVHLDRVTDGSRFIDQTLKTWVATIEPKQREIFVDTLFAILEKTKAKTLKELTLNWYDNARAILKSLRDMDDTMRQNILETLNLLFKSARQNVSINLPISEKSSMKKEKKP